MFRNLIFIFAFAMAALAAQPACAACVCDPDVAFTENPDWNGPYAQAASVDVDAGNTDASFITAAYWQIAGRAPLAAELSAGEAAMARNTGGNHWWRRLDEVNTIMGLVGRQVPVQYSDPWQDYSTRALTTAPCKNLARDVGAVFMFFFGCPEGVNCGLNWAANHVTGMQTGVPDLALWGWGSSENGDAGFYTPADNDGYWYRELLDGRYAGLSFFLPDVYGPDLQDATGTVMGHMVNALAAVSALTGGDRDVKVGMFDDTWGWGNFGFAPWNTEIPDMSTVANQAAAAASICDNKWFPYFDAVPQKYWYTVTVAGQARPIIYFYNAGTLGPSTNASGVLGAARDLFQARYGVYPFLAVDSFFWGADARMGNVADARFTWWTLGLANNLSTYTNAAEGVTLDHATVRFDSISRDHGVTAINTNNQYGVHEGPELLQAALGNTSAGVNILVLGTWNDLGEGTSINRAYDYYYSGAWMSPDYYMNLIRDSQSVTTCPVPSATPSPSPTSTPSATPTSSPGEAGPPPQTAGPEPAIPILPVPNPQWGPTITLDVFVQAPSDRITFRFWSRSMVAIQDCAVAGVFGQGWNHVPVPFAAGLSRGLYFVTAAAHGAATGTETRIPGVGKFFYLHG
jgi:hypothetical protein